jgi:integrase
MILRTPRTPSYRHHRASGQAVVVFNGRCFYLGLHGTPESHAEYDRIVAEWLASGRQTVRPASQEVGDGSTVDDLILSYIKFADGYYVKNGKPTVEPGNIRLALKPLRKLYGHTPAAKFGPLALKATRQAFVEADNCRSEINRRVARIVRLFKWAVENELVPPSVYQGLKAVAWLRKGRSEVRESKPIRPAPEASIGAIRPHVAPQVWAMVELQLLTGMRPGEVVQMRSQDIDMTGRVWTYKPPSHKTEHHDRERTIYIGPRSQEIVKQWLKADPSAYLFSPRDVMAARWEKQRDSRKSKVQPSQLSRAKPSPRKQPGEMYDAGSYRRAIQSACKKAGIASWHPHQLRHNAATSLRKEFSLEIARVILGHTSPVVTEIYAEVDREKALDAMGQVG